MTLRLFVLHRIFQSLFRQRSSFVQQLDSLFLALLAAFLWSLEDEREDLLQLVVLELFDSS